jgi:hypothetical protein
VEQEPRSIKGRLVGMLKDGAYTKYTFEDLYFTDNKYRFMTMTKCPNWHGQDITPLQEGYVTYKYVEAGKDTYYDTRDQTYKQYNYTAIYFIDFVPITHVLNNGYVTEINTLKVF